MLADVGEVAVDLSPAAWQAALRGREGWLRRAVSLASRVKRSTNSSELAISGRSTLIATGRFREVCRPAKTVPMPPSPSSERIS